MRREKGNREGRGSLLAVIIGVMVVVGFLSNLTRKDEPRPPPKKAEPAPPKRTGPSEGMRLIRAKSDVRARLRDPDSATFSRMEVRGEVVCGFVNSRNGFGGMTGPEPFMTRAGVIAAVPSDMPPGEFQEVWDRLC